ncbi:cytochrome C biogenesis protein CcdA [Bacillus sp. FJAT-18017]|jgi:cytochrome c-type biogenesis protein|uniref:cytochrome c biogenesis CcdA family protein n=1 Tax=unclassified Bacillus (in: firmicutes) TaxID=185979 RepID=UPI0005C606A2|nr:MULTISPECIES: cytochrome c biogenesis protein CcdA [unclassified Bacillus (in: firmicutes)]ALC90904.1 cytochrome C biogenesis protein CcdA [Bacillus sp. FJAT-18017]
MGTEVNLFLALGAGFLSFISPCCLPLYPAFLSYITGMSVSDLKSDNGMMQRRSILHTIFFLIGFSSIFIMMGFMTSYIGSFLYQNQDLIRQIGAIFMVIFGLMIIGFFKPEFLMKDRKYQFKNRPAGFAGSVLIGMAFAAGWTPCTGPILGAVLSLAATDPSASMPLMIAYVLGFAIPFFILSFFIGRMAWIKRNSIKIMKVGGSIMIAMGIILFFDWLTVIIQVLQPMFGGFTGF